MYFLFGLGNPGKEYAQTRHNAGFMIIDAIAEQLAQRQNGGSQTSADLFQEQKKFFALLYKTANAYLAKPQTYMNESGTSVRSLLEYYAQDKSHIDLSGLYVIHDDLDIEVGSYKIQLGKGPKVHNGLGSIYQHLHSQQFWHVRIGVDGRQGSRTIPSQQYVLAPFTSEEQILFDQVKKDVVAQLLDALK